MDKKIQNLLLAVCLALLGACASAPQQNASFKLVASADKAYVRGDLVEAERNYRALSEAVPQDAYAFFKLGNTLARQHRFDEAVAAYSEALVRDPSSAKIYNNLATLYLLKAEFALEATVEQSSGDGPIAAQARYKLNKLKNLTQVPLNEVRSPIPSARKVQIYVEKEKPPRARYLDEAK